MGAAGNILGSLFLALTVEHHASFCGDIAAKAAIRDLALASKGVLQKPHGTQAILGTLVDGL